MSQPVRKPGDRVIRRRVDARREITLPDEIIQKPIPNVRLHARFFVGLLTGVGLLGFLLLALPWTTRSGEATPPVDALFTAVSALSVTGLVTVDTWTHWNFFGQFVILILMQLGGLSFMVGASIVLRILSRGSGQRLRDTLLIQDGELTLPLDEASSLMRRVIRYTIIVELAGVLALFAFFFLLEEESIHLAAWRSIFTSVSAFNNGGFDLQGGFQSFAEYSGSIWINVVLISLITLGTISYLVVADVIDARKWKKMTPYTRLVLIVHGALLFLGFFVFLTAEWNGAMADSPPIDRPMEAAFQSVSVRSAGISTVSFEKVSSFTDFVWVALMGIGGASGSPAGGVRIATAGVMFVAVVSIMRGHMEPELFNRRLSISLVMRSMAIITIFFLGHFLAAAALSATEHLYGEDPHFIDVMFESMSAIATVGLSTGITSILSEPGKIVLIITMFVGRLGPLVAVYALQVHEDEKRYRLPETTIHIG